ncbi:phage holin family protein [Geobacillus sp. G4]|uniref:Holin n=4 Tax=Geobacillus TaxID=129337 RepID=A0A7U9JDB8_GEOTM|nr:MULTISPECIES: phage holin family protein [Geobacillus]AKM20137.1 Holin family protein [Geobacillus sp. 12AMOR1]KFL16278.1 holin [Geobacillus stearothermophilus]MED0654238.1 phage holin family protein [Anoxybacillus geothermalis]STO13437.1 Phage-related holin (Lysis protein) [[Flavobacterium] thermophilum]AEV20519.1 toxin secretion/phage lysis holin [Geobacillus thermoleovorans CCB_US3_UF5]
MNKPIPMVAVSLFGSFLSMFVGSVDSFVVILLALVIVDYLTGIAASAVEGKLSSQVGFRGIIRKLLIFVLVAASHLVDLAIGWNMHVIRDAIIFFYIANEFISIVENAGRAGVPIPSVLRKAIELLKDEIK